MVRRKSTPATPQSKSKRISAAKSPSRSIQTPSSTEKTRHHKSPKAKLSQTLKHVDSAKKRKQHPVYMKVGPKIFTVSRKTLKEIKFYQTTTHNLIPKLPFSRLIHEIILMYAAPGTRIQRKALEALQEAAENYLVQYFEDSYTCALHARRSTLFPRDIDVVQRLRSSISLLQ